MFSTEKEEIVYNVLNIFATKKPPENNCFPGGFFRFAVQTCVATTLFFGGCSSAQHYRYALYRLSPTSDFCVSALSVGTLTGLTFLKMQYRVIAYILYKLTALRRNPQRAVNLKKKKKKV